MAELLSQIILRCDSYTNWSENDPILGNGELAVVVLSTADDNLNDTTDTILFKIGNGTKKFSELGWTSSLAADVYEWAKAATRPTYKYGDSDLTGFGSAAAHNTEAIITNSENIPTSKAVITYVANYISALSKVEKIEKVDFSAEKVTSTNIIPANSIIKSVEIQFNTATTRTAQGNINFLTLGVGNVDDVILVKEEELDFETITTQAQLPEIFIFNLNKKVSNDENIIINASAFTGISGTVFVRYI